MKNPAELMTEIKNLKNEMEEYKRLATAQQIHIQHIEKHLNALLQSTCWTITYPIRFIVNTKIRIGIALSLIPFASRKSGGFFKLFFKACKTLLLEGFLGAKSRLRDLALEKLEAEKQVATLLEPDEYTRWIAQFDTLNETLREKYKTNQKEFKYRPLISIIIPVYDPPLIFLEKAIQSVIQQIYPKWELCIADDQSKNPAVREILNRYAKLDERIKVIFRETNGHISAASNSALSIATGNFIALFDNDDLLTEDALYWVVDAINQNPDISLIYSDEDKITESDKRFDPYFKPDFNYELFLAQNVISHFGVYRKSIIDKIGGFRLGFEGAQDYDLALRVIEQIEWEHIIHIPKVLYHWRAIAGSTAVCVDEKNYAVDAARSAIKDHLKRQNIEATVETVLEAPQFQRVRFALPAEKPLVSIIIPTKDRADLLSTCINSILKLSSYPHYEIILVNNASKEKETYELFDRIKSPNIRILDDNSPFNFSSLNNRAAAIAKGSVLCLMNNDIEIITPDWIEEMLSFAMREDVGCVGARLWYPNNTIQHAGVITGINGLAAHIFLNINRNDPGYFGRAVLHQNLSVVTAACLMIRKKTFDAVNGFDSSIAVAFNDVDFCLRVKKLGYRNIWTPYAEMIHHESATRGYEDTPEKVQRFNHEVKYMKNRWGTELSQDPSYNPNLSLQSMHMKLAWPPRTRYIET